MKEAHNNPRKLQARRDKEQLEERKRIAIEDAVTTRLKANQQIVRAQQIQSIVEKEAELEVPLNLVRNVMRKDLAMGYRLAKSVPV